MNYLNCAQAPFGDDVWTMVVEAAVKAARDRLTARRFLDVDGPYGTGLTTIEVGNDGYCRQPGAGRGRLGDRPRDLGADDPQELPAQHPPAGRPSRQRPAAEHGAGRGRGRGGGGARGGNHLPRPGRLRPGGAADRQGPQPVDAGSWTDLDQVLSDVIAAVTKLDDSGFRGPYALVLSPPLYNGLFRRYPGTDLLQLEHLRRLFTKGIFKASIDGGVVVDPRVGPVVVGQDLAAGYIAQDGIHYELFLSESLVLRLDEPEAICTITPKL